MQTTETMTTASNPADVLAIPLLECEPWCTSGDGHPTEHPEDRRCCGQGAYVALSREEPYKEFRGDWCSAYVQVDLRRDPGKPTHVVMNHQANKADWWLDLTIEEAERLAITLAAAVRTARA